MRDRNAFPYSTISREQRWDAAVSAVGLEAVDPQGAARFRFNAKTSIASAGSCFATRVAEALRKLGFNYYVAEPGPPGLSAEMRSAYGYAPLSARYGNIYTTLQLLQLLERANGTFVPKAVAWEAEGGVVDPFRPRIQARPFVDVAELQRDRARHLEAVRRMFAEIEVFVFTLGLTEVWCDRIDGAAFPVCPGRGFGSFDAERYVWRNLDVAENCECLERFLAGLARLNPAAKVLLSVSPVPNAATLEPMHVVRASAYCKAVLRVTAETIARKHPNVDYFASYESVALAPGPEFSLEPDGRTVTPAAVDRVMTMLLRHYFDDDFGRLMSALAAEPASETTDPLCDGMEVLANIEADFR